MEEHQLEIRKKRFSASRVSELTAGGSGKTKMSYIYDLANEAIGIRKDITTKAMLHGINNQFQAMQASNIVYDLGAEWFDEPIVHSNGKLLASPDAVGIDFVVDYKCQSNIYNYIEQCETLLKKYKYQVVCQMMCSGMNKGYLINYLSKMETFGEEWEEYNFPLEERIFMHEIDFDEDIANEILKAVEENYDFIELCINKLTSAIETTEEIFFYLQLKEKCRFVELKDIAWHSTNKEIIRVIDKFYVEKNTK
jgi:hypothetical protein